MIRMVRVTRPGTSMLAASVKSMISLLTAASLFERYAKDHDLADLTVISCVYRSKGEYILELDLWIQELGLSIDKNSLRIEGHWYIKSMSKDRKLSSSEPWMADVKYMVFDDHCVTEDTVCL